MHLLDPTLDVVFKMLFANPRNVRMLISLITAVLQPPSPILRVEVLNPDLPKELATDRGVTPDPTQCRRVLPDGEYCHR